MRIRIGGPFGPRLRSTRMATLLYRRVVLLNENRACAIFGEQVLCAAMATLARFAP